MGPEYVVSFLLQACTKVDNHAYCNFQDAITKADKNLITKCDRYYKESWEQKYSLQRKEILIFFLLF